MRRADVLVEEDRIAEVGAGLSAPEAQRFDAEGALVMPGNVCGHTHLYSVLARGMPPPPRAPRNFPEILRFIWWRLDRALDEPSIRSSGLIGAIDALKAGTTTLIDHHASPSCIEGSLDLLAEELSRAGVRGVLCYEVTDRNGRDGRDEGVRENVRFAREGRWPLMRAMFGAHAGFTLDDESLDEIGREAAGLGVPVHIHVAEDVCDQEDAIRRSGKRVTHRLQDHGVLETQPLLAHGVHLDPEEIRLAARTGAWVAHNCRSNLNNRVGRAPVRALLEELGGRVVMGTDGIDQDLFAESRTAFFRGREDSLEMLADQATGMLAAGAELAGRRFGRPLGRIEPGYLADLVIYDYTPPTTLTPDNLAWHWAFSFTNALVKDVMVNGEWVVRNRSMVRVDGGEARAQAREQAERLWGRMAEIPL